MADRIERKADLGEFEVRISTLPQFVEFLLERLRQLGCIIAVLIPNAVHFSELITQAFQFLLFGVIDCIDVTDKFSPQCAKLCCIG